ncbi:MAG: putative lipid II flippase FtsW, partial [Gemmatimonadetes bacterium]|nr:putative lipid II flippase FtsW [Gemmatimonadota bacterium]
AWGSGGARRWGAGWEGPVLLVVVLALVAFGVVTVYSASAVMAQARGLEDYHFVVRQASGGALGLVVLGLVAQVDHGRLRSWAWPFLGVIVAMLLVLVLPGTRALAPELNGARRWLVAGPLVLQPSELAKLVVTVWTAALVAKKQERLFSLSRGLLPFLLVWGVVVGLIFLEPNLSAAALVLLLAALVAFAGGARIGHFLVLGVVVLPLLWNRVEAVGYRLRRITAFLDPAHDPAGVSYQVHQSLIALGSGGPLGVGFGRGQQKFGFLPEPHNDFVFAVIGEEWGYAGVLVVLGLFTLVGLVGYRIARQAPDLFGFLLAVGLTNLIVVQALLHMAITLALVPATGVTLPFISYGRSSLLVCLASAGVLLSIARAGARAAERSSGGAAARGRRW